MSWLNNILSDEEGTNCLGDKYTALDRLNTSKNDIIMLSKAITEATNPQLRQILTNHLNCCINEHFLLSDMTIQKGWYEALVSPGQQIKSDLQEVQNLLNGQ